MRIRISQNALRAAGLLSVAMLASGCVSSGKFQSVVAERDLLIAAKQKLTGQVEGLVAQTVALEAKNDAFAEDSQMLEGRVSKLQGDLAEYEQINGMLDAQRIDLAQLIEQRNADLARLRGTYDELVVDFAEEIESGQIKIEALAIGIRVSLSDDVLFDTGSAELSDDGAAVVQRVAARVAQVPDRVVVEGHTDDRPIHGLLANRYPTNWELAAARATRVARILAENGTNPERIAATSYGEFHPVASNESDDERARNRRIEIRLLPASIDERIATAQPVVEEAPAAEEGTSDETNQNETDADGESWEGVQNDATPAAETPEVAASEAPDAEETPETLEPATDDASAESAEATETATPETAETAPPATADPEAAPRADAPTVSPVSAEPPVKPTEVRDNEELSLVNEATPEAEQASGE